ncbi:MAG: hypothetical protein II871_05185 [Clostridia bacterium]|nr:hypothetical protein [Clostridia bacterium]
MHGLTNILKSGILTPNTDNFQFIDSLKVMARGMLSIFIVTAILILLVVVLNKYSKKKNGEDK